MPKALFLFAFILLITTPASALDKAGEARLVDGYRAHLAGTELVWPDGADGFAALHRASTAETRQGGVILLHDLGGTPDSPHVIRPLRTGLPTAGWETLAIQLPLAADGDAPNDPAMQQATDARIEAAARWLKGRKLDYIVLLGHGAGAGAALRHLAGRTTSAVRAVALLNLSVAEADRASGPLAALRRLTLPVLDLYGSRAPREVIDTLQERRMAARDSGNGDYVFRRISGADRDFRGLDASMLAAVRGWLRRLRE